MNAIGVASRANGAPARISRPMRRAVRGSAFVESLLAVPVVLLLGLGALQWALLLHARTAAEYALIEAARAGSVGQARPEAIEAGLARGFMPYWFGVDAGQSWAGAVAASNARLREGIAAGWVRWVQLSPTVESFADWGEPARDAGGYPMAGTVEIPNDNLQWAGLRAPAGGVADMRGDEPIGAGSGQTLNDANLLKLELRYGVPMIVPLVGRIAVWVMRIADACVAPSGLTLGTVDLGVPEPLAEPRAWACPVYLAPDASGNPVPRWPVRVAATMRMQSPARRSAATPARTQSAVRGGAAGTGVFAGPDPSPGQRASSSGAWLPPGAGASAAGVPVAPPDAAADDSPAPVSGATASALASGVHSGLDRPAAGWLELGGERTFSVPGACT